MVLTSYTKKNDLRIHSDITLLYHWSKHGGEGFRLFWIFSLSYDPENIGNKSQNRQMGLHQTTMILFSKGKKMKTFHTESEIIFANCTADKGLMSKICKTFN